jgi:C4-dicarboxylate transporter
VITGLDFISDIWVLGEYINSGHNAWLVINIMSVMSPIFVSYVTLVTLIIKNYYRVMTKDKKNEMSNLQNENNLEIEKVNEKKISCFRKNYYNLKNFIPVTPIVIIYLLFIEIIFLINSTIIVPIVFLLKIITCGKCDDQFKCIELSFKKLYDILFDMNDSEVDGFRRLRSIT